MPIYDFVCETCGGDASLLLRHGETAPCPACGGVLMKRLSPFAFSVQGARSAAAAGDTGRATTAATAPRAHVCGAGCSHGPAAAKAPAGGCATDAYAASLVKKYLD